MKCKAIDKAMAYTKTMFFQRGSVRSDSDEDKAFMALSISITTRIDRDIVDAVRAVSSPNMEHEMSANLRLVAPQEWKCV